MQGQLAELCRRIRSRLLRRALLAISIGLVALIVAVGCVAGSTAGAPGAATPDRAAEALATPPSRDAAALRPTDAAAPEVEGSGPTTGPSPEPGTTATNGASPPGEVRRVRVANTEGQGANLRREPNASSQRTTAVREGAVLDLVGPDRQTEGRTWRNVQDDRGNTGWVPAELLVEERETGPRPTPTPIPLGIQVTEISSPVGRGDEAELQIVTRPGTRCEARLLLFGPATLPRLEPKVADERGACAWTWTVPPNVVPGTWRYSIAVGSGENQVTREVTFRVR